MNFSFRNANRPPIFSQAGFIFNFDKFAFLCTACSSFGNRILLHYRRWVLDLIPQQHKSSDILETFIGWSMKTQCQDSLDLIKILSSHTGSESNPMIFLYLLYLLLIKSDQIAPSRYSVIVLNQAHFVVLKWSICSFFFFEVFRYFCVAILAEDTRSSLQV